jgi:hypothetical protein
MRSVTLPSTSGSDDAALRALHDASAAMAHLQEACIVGGQMVALLCAAFPSAGMIARRTADADAGISPAIATAGTLHDLLLDRGYTPQRGNHYTRGDREIDILVPARTHLFESAEYGGRVFDSAPGLGLALTEHLELEVTAVLLDGTPLTFRTRVPGVERALIVKALSYESRRSRNDMIDLFNLLQIRHSNEPAEIGGWRIGDRADAGARRDAATALNRLAGAPGLRLSLRGSDVPPSEFSALLRRYITAV